MKRRKYVASISRRGKNSQSRCAKQGSRGPNSICLWRGGPQKHVFGERSIPRAILFYGKGRVSKSIFAKLKKTLSCFPSVFNFFLGWEGG